MSPKLTPAYRLSAAAQALQEAAAERKAARRAERAQHLLARLKHTSWPAPDPTIRRWAAAQELRHLQAELLTLSQ